MISANGVEKCREGGILVSQLALLGTGNREQGTGWRVRRATRCRSPIRCTTGQAFEGMASVGWQVLVLVAQSGASTRLRMRKLLSESKGELDISKASVQVFLRLWFVVCCFAFVWSLNMFDWSSGALLVFDEMMSWVFVLCRDMR